MYNTVDTKYKCMYIVHVQSLINQQNVKFIFKFPPCQMCLCVVQQYKYDEAAATAATSVEMFNGSRFKSCMTGAVYMFY